jgi:hypothetical protein
MMNNTWKKALSVLIAVALTLSFAACAGKNANASASDATASDATASDATATADPSRDEVAVKIGDNYTITKGDIMDEYDYMVSMYSAYGMSAPTADADVEAMQDSVISTLVADKIQLYEANLLGAALTDEQTAEVTKQVEDQMTYYTDSFRSQAQSEGATDVEARTLEIFQEQLDAAGMDMDVDGFRAYMTEQYTNAALKDALKAMVTKDITATDEEIQNLLHRSAEVPEGFLHHHARGLWRGCGRLSEKRRRPDALYAGRLCARALHLHLSCGRGFSRLHHAQEELTTWKRSMARRRSRRLPINTPRRTRRQPIRAST